MNKIQRKGCINYNSEFGKSDVKGLNSIRREILNNFDLYPLIQQTNTLHAQDLDVD